MSRGLGDVYKRQEIRIDTSELIDREYVIVLRKKIEDEDEYEEKRIRFAIGNQNKK